MREYIEEMLFESLEALKDSRKVMIKTLEDKLDLDKEFTHRFYLDGVNFAALQMEKAARVVIEQVVRNLAIEVREE